MITVLEITIAHRPIGPMYDIFTYICLIFRVNVAVDILYMDPMGYDMSNLLFRETSSQLT